MTDLRREQRAARRRTSQLLVQRRLAVMRDYGGLSAALPAAVLPSPAPPSQLVGSARTPLDHASISSTEPIPTDS